MHYTKDRHDSQTFKSVLKWAHTQTTFCFYAIVLRSWIRLWIIDHIFLCRMLLNTSKTPLKILLFIYALYLLQTNVMRKYTLKFDINLIHQWTSASYEHLKFWSILRKHCKYSIAMYCNSNMVYFPISVCFLQKAK